MKASAVGLLALFAFQNTSTFLPSPASGGGLPAGMIGMVISGSCPTGYSQVAALDGKSPLGTVVANANVGTTGGADTITPAGTNAAPTFTGSSASTSLDSAGTPAGTNTLGAVSAHAGTAVADHAAHTHTFTSSSNATTPDLLTVNTAAAGVAASGTTGNPSATLTHTVTQPSNHTFTQPTFTGTAMGTHGHTVTATGTNSAPAFTGTQFDNRSAFARVIFCQKD